MPYFLSGQTLSSGQEVVVSGPEAAHITLSRRTRPGDQIILQGTDEKRFSAKVLEVGKDTVKILAAEEVAVPKELATRITIFQSVISEKALDFLFQKATELGAAGITLFNSQNTATKLTQEQFEKKRDRWNKILWEAAKQCERGKIPDLAFSLSVSEVVTEAQKFKNFFVLDSSGASLSSSASSVNFESPIGLVIGPEGGFTETELDQLSKGPTAMRVSLGPYTLRAETASLAGLSMILTKI